MPLISESEKLDRKEMLDEEELMYSKSGEVVCKHGLNINWCSICKEGK